MTALPATPAPRFKLALLLGLAAAIATVAVLPYYFGVLAPLQPVKPSPLAVVGSLLLQYGAGSFLLAWLGLWLGERYGLTAPWLRAWVYRQPPPHAPHQWSRAASLGIVAGLVALAVLTDWRHLPHPPTTRLLGFAWRGALAMFQGGVAEEILCRLFTVSLLVWLMARLGGGARTWMYVAAIVLAALLFGAGHLPTAFRMGMASSPWAIAGIVFSNAIVGLPCGWLFWKYGLEHAMVAHFCADFVLHVASPLALIPFA